jgi:hypothetical protein
LAKGTGLGRRDVILTGMLDWIGAGRSGGVRVIQGSAKGDTRQGVETSLGDIECESYELGCGLHPLGGVRSKVRVLDFTNL